ncbi:hypothetical protein OAX78_00695 [Planctomycetota bacterium]|nr:hypothetical protein [Planctomycetota bacterium]
MSKADMLDGLRSLRSDRDVQFAWVRDYLDKGGGQPSPGEQQALERLEAAYHELVDAWLAAHGDAQAPSAALTLKAFLNQASMAREDAGSAGLALMFLKEVDSELAAGSSEPKPELAPPAPTFRVEQLLLLFEQFAEVDRRVPAPGLSRDESRARRKAFLKRLRKRYPELPERERERLTRNEAVLAHELVAAPSLAIQEIDGLLWRHGRRAVLLLLRGAAFQASGRHAWAILDFCEAGRAFADGDEDFVREFAPRHRELIQEAEVDSAALLKASKRLWRRHERVYEHQQRCSVAAQWILCEEDLPAGLAYFGESLRLGWNGRTCWLIANFLIQDGGPQDLVHDALSCLDLCHPTDLAFLYMNTPRPTVEALRAQYA